jgi:hypothetical protein
MNTINILICIFFYLFLIGCHSPGKEVNSGQTHVYTGKIASDKITMLLTFNDDKSIEGFYVYKTRPDTIKVSGEFEKNRFRLVQQVARLDTSIFEGNFLNYNTIKGSFIVADSFLIMPFVLEELYNNSKPGGHYQHMEASHRYFDVLKVSRDSIKFQGEDYWRGNAGSDQIHLAQVAGYAKIKDNEAEYIDESGNVIKFIFHDNNLEVQENGSFGGLNTTFHGSYKKKDSMVSDWMVFHEVIHDPYKKDVPYNEETLTEKTFEGWHFPYKILNLPPQMKVLCIVSGSNNRVKEITSLSINNQKIGELFITKPPPLNQISKMDTSGEIEGIPFDSWNNEMDLWGKKDNRITHLYFQSEEHEMMLQAKMEEGYDNWFSKNFKFKDPRVEFSGKCFPFKITNIPEGLQVSSEIIEKDGTAKEVVIWGLDGQQYGEIVINPFSSQDGLEVKNENTDGFIGQVPYFSKQATSNAWGLESTELRRIRFASKQHNISVDAQMMYVYEEWFLDSFVFTK